MQGRELMYDWPSYAIALALFVLLVGSLELGRIAGRRAMASAGEEVKDHANSVQASLLGLLALLLGFTFSLSLQRYDDRSAAVVTEANALGTAFLRADLLEPARGEQAKRLLRQYGDIRVEAGSIAASNYDERADRRGEAVAAALWRLAAEESRANSGPAAVSFATALNEAFDSFASRDAAIDRHVPELVLFLLFGTFLLLGGVVGYSSAIAGVRPGLPIYSLMLLIVVLVFIIIDLDRPRRGLISVDQTKLIQAVETMDAGGPPPSGPAAPPG